MEPGCIPFCKLPGASRLFCDYSEHFERVRAFYPLDPREFLQLNDGLLKSSYPAERRKLVADVLSEQNRNWGASPETLRNIERLRRGSSAMVTGQQVALFGGPAYSFYKALSAVKIAEQLTQAGTDCVPIFWMAAEDHDFAEVSSVTFRSPNGLLKAFAIESNAPDGSQVGAIKLGDQIGKVVQAAGEFLDKSEAAALLARCYTASETLSTAMAKLFTAIFGRYGLIVLDPLDARLHAVAKPIYGKAISDSAEIYSALHERDGELERAGYHSQVLVKPSSTLLFETVDGIRTPMRRNNGGFAVGDKKTSQAEVEKRVNERPENFSGNALLRPVIQDFLLPSLAYIGGPAEIAYFAQSSAVYQHLLGRVTPILPRFGATLLDSRDQRILKRYKLAPQEALKSKEAIQQMLAERSLPSELEVRFERTKSSVQAALGELTKDVTKLDSTLGGAAERAASKISYQLTRLRGRAARAQVRRDKEISQHAEALANSLYPKGQLQEREIAGISYIAQFGAEVVSKLYDSFDPAHMAHRLIPL